MFEWSELATRSPRPHRSPVVDFAFRWLPALAIAAALWLLGLHELATIVVVLSLAVTLAAGWSDRVAGLLERVVTSVGGAVAFVVGGVLQTVVFVVIFLPAWGMARLLRRDPLRPPASSRSGTGLWSPRRHVDPAAAITHLFSQEKPPSVPTRAGRVASMIPVVVGSIAILAVVDVAVGSALHDDEPETVSSVEDQIAAATLDDPWFPDYWRELVQVEYERVPFVISEPRDFAGEHITITGGRRQGYEPDGLPASAPVVDVFGGSTIWGEGQRDGHTIPSELTRLAEADGLAIRFENHGQRGDTNFTEALRLERIVTGDGPLPAMAVFVDGPDEIIVQAEHLTGQPGQYGFAETVDALAGTDDRSLWERYADASVITDGVRWAKGVFAVLPASAQEPTDVATTAAPSPQEVADAAVSVYDRGRDIADFLGARAGIPVRHAWQPVEAVSSPGSAYERATADLSPEVIDLSAVLDDPPDAVYLDGTHTNELGARLVAEALYAQLRPDLETLDGARP